MRRVLAVLAACAVGTFALAGTASAARRTGDGDISISGNGGSITVGSDLPDALKGVPLPPRSKVIGSFSGADENSVGAFATIAVKDKVNKFVKTYMKKLKSKGYRISNKYTATLNGTHSVTFTIKKGKLKGAMSIVDDTNTEGYKSAMTITVSS